MGVQEALLMVRQTPLGHDRTAARDDAGDALGGEWYIAQQNPGVDGEIVHALFGLLDQGVAENFPGQFFGAAIDFFQRRSEEHTSELQSLMRISYAVFCLKKKNIHNTENKNK